MEAHHGAALEDDASPQGHLLGIVFQGTHNICCEGLELGGVECDGLTHVTRGYIFLYIHFFFSARARGLVLRDKDAVQCEAHSQAHARDAQRGAHEAMFEGHVSSHLHARVGALGRATRARPILAASLRC